jgi:hypothetical protein
MSLPLQQAGDPTSARKPHQTTYIATPEPGLLSREFYAAEVEELRDKPFVSCIPVTTRQRDTSANVSDVLNRCFDTYTALAAAMPHVRGTCAMTQGRGSQLYWPMASIIRISVGRLILFGLPMLFTSRIPTKLNTHVLNTRKQAWLERSAIELGFHQTNLFWNAQERHIAQFAAFRRTHGISNTLQLV